MDKFSISEYERIIYRAPVAALLAVVLSGCGGIVYKERAGQFVEAGRAVSTAFDEAAASKGQALETYKRIVIAHDLTCKISNGPVLIRTGLTLSTTSLSEFAKLADPLLEREQCAALKMCVAQPTSSNCKSSCLSDGEARCLAQIEKSLIKKRDALPKTTKEHPLKTAAKDFDRLMRGVELGRPRTVAQRIAEDSMTVFTDYLDLLEAHVDADPAEVSVRASALVSKIDARKAEWEALTGAEVATGASAQIDKAKEYLGAIGTLGSVVREIYRNNKDATAIRRIVRENERSVSSAIKDVKLFLLAERNLGSIVANTNNRELQAHLGTVFEMEKSVYKRFELLADLPTHRNDVGPDGNAAVEKLFVKLDETHSSLVTLVNDPTSEDKKAIFRKAFREFLDVVSGVVKIIKLG